MPLVGNERERRAEHPTAACRRMRPIYSCFKLRFGQFYGEGDVGKKAVGKVVAVCAGRKVGQEDLVQAFVQIFEADERF